ncbi:hypothetical protein STENM327S_03504 [Streptomyces tendae]
MTMGPHHTAAFGLLSRIAEEAAGAGSPRLLDALAAAAVSYDGALDTFRRLGARPWIERAEAELRAAGIEPAGVAPGAIAELTPQQQQIVGWRPAA